MFVCLNNAHTKTRRKDKEVSREKQVQVCLDAFRRVLRTQQAEPTSPSIVDSYRSLLSNSVVTDALPEVANIQDSPIHALQFVVHLNYAKYLLPTDKSLAKLHFKKATEVDPSSCHAWIQLGTVALTTNDSPLACRAFERALQKCQNKIEYWNALKGLSEATFAIGDFASCSSVLSLALPLNPSYERGIQMKEEIEKEQSDSLNINTRPKSIHIPEQLSARTLALSDWSWKEYGTLLLEAFSCDEKDYDKPLLSLPITVVFEEKEDLADIQPVEVAADDAEDEEMQDNAEDDDEDDGGGDDGEKDTKAEDADTVEMTAESTSIELAVSEEIQNSETKANEETATLETDEAKASEEKGATEDPQPEIEAEPEADEETPPTTTKTSPLKRKKRFRDLESRASKRGRKGATEAPTTPEEETPVENDLLTDEEFYTTITEDVLPSTGDITALTYGEEQFGRAFLEVFEKRLVDAKLGRVAAEVEEEDGFVKPALVDSIESPLNNTNPFMGVDAVREFVDLQAGKNVVEVVVDFILRMVVVEEEDGSVRNLFVECKWPSGIRDVVVELVCEVEAKGGSFSKICGAALENGKEKKGLEVVLAICELLFDRVLELKTQNDTVGVEKVTGVLEVWWAIICQTVALNSNVVNSMGDEWLLRKYWVQAQMNEHFNHISSAVDTYKDCLEVSFRRKNLPAVVLANCRFHSKISKETIKSRLQSISLEQYLRLAENEFSHGNFKSVLNKLHPFLFQDNTFPAWFSALLFPDTAAAASNYSFLTNALVLELEVSQRIRILTMLERAYSQTGMVTELFIARVFLVVSEVRNVLTLKGPELLKRIATLSTILKNLLDMLVLNEGQDLFRILKDNDAMLPVLDFMGCSSTENVIKDVLSGLFAAARLAWVIVKLCSFKRYQRDDVLVNFALRTWSVMYYVCKTLETKKAKRVGLEWLFLAHSQLGEVSICGRDDAFFLNLVIRICLAKKGGESMSELYQGFCCLYGLTNTVDPDSPLLEHNSDLRDFDEKAAAAVFAPLSKFVKDKLATQNYKSITSDIRDSIDTISEKFSEPPFKNYEVSLNRSLIDKFLVSGIHGKQTRSIGIVAVIPHKVEYYDLYKDIFFIRGKLSCIQRRAVVGVKTKKSFESLEIASEEFLHNLYMNPFSVNAWLLSADVYCSLSYEYLSWNANDIIANIQLIREYQLKSFHCYEQVLCLLKDRQFTVFNDGQIESNLTVAEHSLFSWGNFGFLCYSMIASPINCIAVKSSTLKSRTVWASRYAEMNSNAALVAEGFDTVEAAEALGKSILLSRGIEAFRMAHKADSAEWRYPFMLGKMSIMSDQDVEVVVDYFEKAIELLPEDSGMKEQETILDVHYCLVSFLCKRLYAGKVEPDYVIAVLEKSTLNKDGSMTPTETEAREDRTMEAYDKIQQELTYMKLIDKKKWQHRPYYKSYWLYKNIYNDLEKAKAELLNIFQLRSNARSFINFWKPEFERPGRHYVYIHKYTMALISVLRDLKDLESLRHLVRKSQKAYDVLLYPQAVWKAGFDAMNELLLEKVKEVTWTQFVKTIPQKEFLAHAPALEKKFMWSNNEERTEDASFLHTAFHLKKLNEGMEDDTLISRILVLLYCKLFLAHLETNASVEENETLAEDSSSYFALVLRRCLVACKIPWNKRPTAEQDAGEAEGDANAATNGAESSQGVATENGTARVEGNDVMQGVEALETSVENTGTHTSPEKNGLNAIDAPVQGVEDVEALDPAQFENIFNMNPFVKDKEGDISVVHEEI